MENLCGFLAIVHLFVGIGLSIFGCIFYIKRRSDSKNFFEDSKIKKKIDISFDEGHVK